MTRHGQSDTAKKLIDWIKAWRVTTVGSLCEHTGLAPSTILLYRTVLRAYDPFIRFSGDTFTYEAPQQPNINTNTSRKRTLMRRDETTERARPLLGEPQVNTETSLSKWLRADRKSTSAH